ncbi:MAG TPA: type II toxin-antitoxin system PemK/MazF family toxin [Candidatus Elarobacter sp.]
MSANRARLVRTSRAQSEVHIPATAAQLERCYHHDVALRFFPGPGMILMCDFSGYVLPEIVKTRRVVVVSPKRLFQSLWDVTLVVVPLSEIEPRPLGPWHHCIPSGRYRGVATCWAKADLLAHVSLARLNRIYYERDRIVPVVYDGDLQAIRAAAAAAIGIGLT